MPPAASALFIARGQRGGAGRRGAAGDCLGQRPPAAGRGQGGAARRRPAPGTRSLQRPRGRLRRRCPPWAQPSWGCPGTGGFLRAEARGAAERGGEAGAGGSPRQVGAGALVPACPPSPSSCARPSVRPSVPPGLSRRLPPTPPLSPGEKLHGPEAGRTGSGLPA